MSSPPSKKQKTDNPKSPIVFTCPGQKPDVKLVVFDQEFHVHSVILKLNSAFFHKFLDSADKVGPETGDRVGDSTLTPPEASQIGLGSTFNFKYEWVTKIDEEDKHSWFLVEDNLKNHPYEVSIFEGDKERETSIFEKLLCALYNKAYRLQDAEELLHLIKFADYYRALPTLSRTLDGALVNSQAFRQNLSDHAIQLFPAAAKLRNALLFRECLVWIVGPHDNPRYKEIKDRTLRMIAQVVHGEVSARVLGVTAVVVEQTAKYYFNSTEKYMCDEILQPVSDRSLQYPRWLKAVWDCEYIPSETYRGLQSLLESNLVLDKGTAKAGEGNHEDHFFCASISDEDLPWDITETDW